MRPPKGRGKTSPPALEWTVRALTDLREIEDCIAADDPAAADRWIARLMATAEAAARTPLAGRVVPERANDGVREVFLGTYRVVYRVREREILVLTVFEGHRRFPRGVEADE